MFCSECGKEAAGKFCWNCGAPLRGPAASATVPTPPAAAPTAPSDWQNETNYDALLRNPEVRDLLARQSQPEAHMTGEEFVDACSKILNVPVSVAPAMGVMQDVFGRLGVHTGKSRSEVYAKPVGRVIVSVLCALASGGYQVKEVRQASDGCVLTSEIPSDMFSLAGQLVVAVHRAQEGTSIHAETRIEGQLYDWGKARRCLDHLFDGVAGAV